MPPTLEAAARPSERSVLRPIARSAIRRSLRAADASSGATVGRETLQGTEHSVAGTAIGQAMHQL